MMHYKTCPLQTDKTKLLLENASPTDIPQLEQNLMSLHGLTLLLLPYIFVGPICNTASFLYNEQYCSIPNSTKSDSTKGM